MGNAIVTSCSTSAPLPSKETENETFMAGSSQSSLFLEQWKRQFSWQDPSLERKNVKDTLSCRICFHDSSPYTTLNDNNWSLYANEVQLAIKFLGDCIPICQQCSFLSHVICFTILHCFHDFRCECKHTPFTCVDCQHHYDSLHEVIPQMICLACAIAPEKYIPFFPQNTELHEAHQLLLHTIQNDNNNVQTILCGIQKSKLLQQIKNHLLTNCYQAIQEITHLCYNCFFLDQELMAKKLPPLSMQLLQKDHAMQKNYAEDNRPFFSLLTCQFSQDNRDFFEQQYLFEQMEYAVVQKIRDFDPEKITEICNALSSITSHKFEADGIQTRILFKITSISSLIDLIIRDATMLERLRQHLPQREEILEILEESPCILTEQNDTHIGHLLFILLTEGKLIENECAQEKQDDTRIGHLLFILQRTIQDDQNTLQKDAAFIKKTTSAIHLYSQICQAGISFDKFLQKPFLQTHRQFLLKHTHQSIDIDLLRIYADALHAFLLEQLRFRHQTQPFDNPQYILSIIPQSLDKEEKNSRPFSFLQKILSQEIPNLSMQELFAMASLHTSSFVNQLILIYHAKKDPTKVHKKDNTLLFSHRYSREQNPTILCSNISNFL